MLLDSDENRIQHMIDAAECVLKFIAGRTRPELDMDLPLQSLIIRQLEILGEAASRVSHKYRVLHPEIEWRDAVDMRNKLVHTYFDINFDIIWSTAQRILPELLPKLKRLLPPAPEQK